MSFHCRRSVESILIVRGKDHFSLFSVCVFWKEQKTLTSATSTISFIVFFTCWEIHTPSCRKRSSLAYASKTAIYMLHKSYLNWLTYVQEPTAAGLYLNWLIPKTLAEYYIPIPDIV